MGVSRGRKLTFPSRDGAINLSTPVEASQFKGYVTLPGDAVMTWITFDAAAGDQAAFIIPVYDGETVVLQDVLVNSWDIANYATGAHDVEMRVGKLSDDDYYLSATTLSNVQMASGTETGFSSSFNSVPLALTGPNAFVVMLSNPTAGTDATFSITVNRKYDWWNEEA